MTEPQHIVFAIDISGSTARYGEYHDRIYEIAGKLRVGEMEHGDKVSVLLWSDRCAVRDLGVVLENSAPNGQRAGVGGTYVTPLFEKICELIGSNGVIDRLILVTDGEIDRRSVDNVFEGVLGLLDKGSEIPWKFTEAHIVSRSELSVSVVAPFIYRVGYEIFVGGVGATPKIADTEARVPKAACYHKDVIEMIRAITSETELTACFDRLYDRIVADTLVQVDPMIRDELIWMQKRIIALSAVRADDADGAGEIMPLTEEAVYKAAIDWYNGQSEIAGVPGMVSKLVNLCSTKSHDLKLARFERNYKEVASVRVDDLDCGVGEIAIEEVCDEYEDPVLMDKDMPVVLFAEGSGILNGIENDEIRREIERCPLNLLKYDGLVSAIGERINPVHGLRFCREYLKAGGGGDRLIYDDYGYSSDEDYYEGGYGGRSTAFVSPETRRVLMKEVMCFGNDVSHVRANKACIAKLLTGTNKLCGQYGLWMVVFYSILKWKGFVRNEIGGVLDKYIADFIVNTPRSLRVFMGLDGSGMRPCVKVPVAHALLYGIVSTRLWADEHMNRDITRDLFRVYPYMRDVLKLVIGDFDFSGFDRRIRILEIAASLLWRIKRVESPAKVVMRELQEKYMKKLELTGEDGGKRVYLLDGIEKVPDEDVVVQICLLENNMVHQNMKFTDVKIGFDWRPEFRDYVPVYTEAENAAEARGNVAVYIHPRTLRPLLTDWKKKSEMVYGDIGGQVSVHYQLLKFFLNNGRFPVQGHMGDLRLFIDQLACAYKSKGCLPVSILFHVRCCIDEIMEAFEKRPDGHKNVERVRADILAGESIEGRWKLEEAGF